MTLTALIRKHETSDVATAIPATPAIQLLQLPVAKIATVAIASAIAAHAATASRWWRIRYSDGKQVVIACFPNAMRGEIMAQRDGALAAEPFELMQSIPSAPLRADEEQAIRIWLTNVGETDPAILADVLHQCQSDADVRDCFMGLASEARPGKTDDRHRCGACANLTVLGSCSAARRGELAGCRRYEPIQDIPRRCQSYVPRHQGPT